MKDAALSETIAGTKLNDCKFENLGIIGSMCWYKVSSSTTQPISKCRRDGPNFAPADINSLSIVRASITVEGLEWIDSLSIGTVDLAIEPINCEGLSPSYSVSLTWMTASETGRPGMKSCTKDIGPLNLQRLGMLEEREGAIGENDRPMQSCSDGHRAGMRGRRFSSMVRAGSDRVVISFCVVSQLEKRSCSRTDMVSQLRLKCFKRNAV